MTEINISVINNTIRMSHCKKNVVGIATVYGVGGPGIDSQWE